MLSMHIVLVVLVVLVIRYNIFQFRNFFSLEKVVDRGVSLCHTAFMQPIMTFEQAVRVLAKSLDDPISDTWGSYNHFCPSCFYRAGHQTVWCIHCGAKMVVYTSQPVRPTYRQWILHATTQAIQQDRLAYLMCSHESNGKIKFPFVWSNEAKHCTTPKFFEALTPLLTQKG